MIHPNTEVRYINENIGMGVFATAPIPKGTIVWVQDPLDHVLSPKAIKNLPETLRNIVLKYTFRNPKGHYVLCWDTTRFVNHSFSPNVMITPYDFDIAIADIPAGTELRGDYGCLNIIEPFEPDAELGSSRSIVTPDDLLHHYKEWDVVLKEAFSHIPKVEQTFQAMLGEKKWAKVCKIAEGKAKLDSVLKCYLKKKQSPAKSKV